MREEFAGKVVSEMFREAGISERKTNHSLRAAGVSQFFEAGVDEKIIQSHSGHRSTDALRMYGRITPAQQQAVSNILTSGEKKEYWEEMQTVSAQPSAAVGLLTPTPYPGSVALARPYQYPGAVQSPVWTGPMISTPRPATVQSVESMHSTTSSPALLGIQCCGHSTNIYWEPVSQRLDTKPVDVDLSHCEFKRFSDF